MKPISDRLWAKTDIKTPDECWEWQGWRHPSGHGQIGRGRRSDGLAYTHVAAWEVSFGPVPDGLCVCHKCDNPPCVNPAHLFLGSPKDNVRDMINKRRHSYGEAHATKLTEVDVVAIRGLLAKGITQREIASQFSVSRSMIGNIARDKRWTLLPSDPRVREILRNKPLQGDSETCPKGHQYSEVGFYQTGDGRRCKACHKERMDRYLANGGREKKNRQARILRART